MHGVLPLEERFPSEQFRKDASNTPHIHRCIIIIGVAQELWGPVPPRLDVPIKERIGNSTVISKSLRLHTIMSIITEHSRRFSLINQYRLLAFNSTHSVRVSLPSWSTPRARPKSHMARSQLALSTRLDGLRSRCRTLALWMYLRPRRSWQRQYIQIIK